MLEYDHHSMFAGDAGTGSSQSPPISIPAAIVVGLLAALVQSFGLTLQRKSHIDNELLPPEEQTRDWKRPRWLLGFAIFTLSNALGSVWQLGSLPIVILAPLGGVSLVWNAILARIILKDSFTRYLFIGTFLIAGGAVLVALFGTVDEPTHTLDELMTLYTRPAFIVWITLLCFSVALLLCTAHIAEWRIKKRARLLAESLTASPVKPKRRKSSRRRRWSSASDLTFTADTEGRKTSMSAPTSPVAQRFLLRAAAFDDDDPDNEEVFRGPSWTDEERKRLLIGLAFGAASGTLSGLCLLFAKTSTELLLLTITTRNQFNRPQPWLILIVLAIAAVLQLWYLNRSLRLVGPTLICPSAFCFYSLSSILNGLVYYDQASRLSGLQIGLVILGVLVLLSGVWIVSLKTSDPELLEAGAPPMETTPLLNGVVSALSTSTDEADEDGESALEEEDDAESAAAVRERTRRATLADLFLWRDDQPRGLSIGLGAASPGFAVRPRGRGSHARTLSGTEVVVPAGQIITSKRHARRRSTNYSLAGEPYVGIYDATRWPSVVGGAEEASEGPDVESGLTDSPQPMERRGWFGRRRGKTVT